MRTLGVLLFLFGACTPAPPATFEPMELLAGQCHWVADTCHIDESTDLVLFLPDTGTITVSVDGRPLPLHARPYRLGTQVTLTAPVPIGAFEIQQDLKGVVRRDAFPVARKIPRTPLRIAARAARSQPDCEEIIGAMVDDATPDELGYILNDWASCARRQRRREAYIDRLSLSKQQHQRQKQTSTESHRDLTLAQLNVWNNRSIQAFLQNVGQHRRDATGQWAKDHYTARAHEATGDIRRAKDSDEKAIQTAVSTGLSSLVWKTKHSQAIRADALGNSEKAVAILANTPTKTSCLQDWLAKKSMHWYRMNLSERSSDFRNHAEVRHQLSELESSKCFDHARYAASLNLDQARAAFLDDAVEDAAKILSNLKPDALIPDHEFWYHDLMAEVAIRRHDPSTAAVEWKLAFEIARLLNRPALRIRALGGIARSEVLGHNNDEATKYFQRARDDVNRSAQSLSFHAERGPWFDAHEQLTGAEAHHVLSTDGAEAAAELLRVERRRRVATLARIARPITSRTPEWLEDLTSYRNLRDELARLEYERWNVPSDQVAGTNVNIEQVRADTQAILDRLIEPSTTIQPPAPPGQGELILLWWPLADGRIIAIGTSQGETRHHILEPDPSDVAMLAPFSEQIRSAKRIRLLPANELANRDLHSAKVGQKHLIEWAPVEWAIDIPVATRKPLGGSLVVGNPTNDLPNAEQEAQMVASHYNTKPMLTDSATLQNVYQDLSTVEHAHLATHGGAEGLRLHDALLTPGDILALPNAPKNVFLSGCETGASEYGLGLAQTFVLAGSHHVIGTIRPVSDIDSTVMVRAWLNQTSGSPAQRMAAAQRSLQYTHPEVDWSAWRVWTP